MKTMQMQVEGSPAGNPRTQEFAYLWAKHVTGISPGNHCANCLRGGWEKQVRRGMVDGLYTISAETSFFYLCGVARTWKDNLHLAVAFELGSTAMVDTWNGVRFTIRDARRIRINPLPDGWEGLPRSFTTCRNFQFAVQEFGYSPAPKQQRLDLRGQR